jgi:TldD protein
MITELDSLDVLGSEIVRRGELEGVLVVWRAQTRVARAVLVRDGRVEESSRSSSSGHGIQVVTSDGRTAFGSRDDFREEAALALLGRLTRAAERGAALGVEAVRVPALSPTTGRAVPPGLDAFDRIDLGEIGRRLVDLESQIRDRVAGVRVRIAFGADLDAWRVRRSDGTDVVFAMPRCTLRMTATSSEGHRPHSISAFVSGSDPGLPWDAEQVERFRRRALQAARLATALPDAPNHPAGSFPLVIDYALAKGLAHEAFGHASEADSYRSSVLAAEGRFRTGEKVGPDHVSIVDEPVEGDHAWQPFSANGVPRERAVIVDRGRLCDGLSDPWSADSGGVRVTGAARAESFRSAPLPRMSNIRIEVDAPLPAGGEFEDYGPAEVRDLLDGAGVLRRHPRVAFLSGYSGGQVNTATGDFVFNCKAIYDLSRDGCRLHKAAIFSGSMFGALGAIREAFGPLRLDAIGTCGKWGQAVPSSGGSHFFLVLDPDPSVRLGGE